MERKLVLATPPNQYFLERLVAHARSVSGDESLPFDLAPPDAPPLFEQFSDGEWTIKLPRGRSSENYVRRREVVLIGGTPIWTQRIEDEETGHTIFKQHDGFNFVHDSLYALEQCSVSKIDVAFQYYGYSRQERYTPKKEHPIGGYRADTLGRIAGAANARVVFNHLDLHADAIMAAHGFLGVSHDHDYAERFHVQIMRDLIERFGRENLIITTTDASRAEWAKNIALHPKVRLPLAIIIKEHVDVRNEAGPNDGVQSMASAGLDQCRGKIAVSFDDMIGSGKSVINAAREVMDAGAQGVIADATHGVLQENALASNLAGAMYGDKPLLMEVHVLDTLEWAVQLTEECPRDDFYHVHSATPLVYDKFWGEE